MTTPPPLSTVLDELDLFHAGRWEDRHGEWPSRIAMHWPQISAALRKALADREAAVMAERERCCAIVDDAELIEQSRGYESFPLWGKTKHEIIAEIRRSTP